MDHQVAWSTTTEQTSQPYVGRWNRLISTTNWEKGRIVHEWKSALIAAGAPATEHSDEAWSRMVRGVTGQHVGRLRRVYDRFGDVFAEYEGLYWSHFQAALDWDDAEMWLEGAVQSDWSVSQMRRQRWQTMGGVSAEEPQDGDLTASDTDEDHVPLEAEARRSRSAKDGSPTEPVHEEPRSPAGPDFGDEDESRSSIASTGTAQAEQVEAVVAEVKPFEDVADLPDDLAEAFEMFRLAILHHKAEHWQQIPRSSVIGCLEALKLLVETPG